MGVSGEGSRRTCTLATHYSKAPTWGGAGSGSCAKRAGSTP